tara:strand:- start:560 stop:841 length:282 start_codon:yes stop_codon:yes gene_type:complete
MIKDNPKKLSDFQRRKLHYQELWGLNEKNSTLDKYEVDLRSQMRQWVQEADKEKADQEKKNKLSKVIPKKVDVDSITKSRMFYENLMGDKDND